MKTTSVKEFYNDIVNPLFAEISKEISHLDVLRYEDLIAKLKKLPMMF